MLLLTINTEEYKRIKNLPNLLKKDYRARFCHGGGKEIDVQPGQNILKIIQDCFESCGNDVTINSENNDVTTCCSTPVVRNKKGASGQSKKPNAGLTNSLKNTSNSSDSLSASPLKAVNSKGWSLKSHSKTAIHDANKIESPLSPGETRSILKDVEAQCRSPANLSAFRDDHESGELPLLVKEAVTSPVHILQSDEPNTPAVVKSHVEVENLRGPQSGKKQIALVQGTGHIAISSLQKNKSFSSAFLAAVTTAGKRCSASISPPSPPLVKDQDLEIENECEFLIDESNDVSFNSWFSIPKKNKTSKTNGSATPALKSQFLERQKTESRKEKNRKVQSEAPHKQKMPDFDVRVQPDFRITSESETASSDKKGKVLKSQRQSSTPREKTKKEALRQDSPKQRRGTSWKPEDKELFELDKKASDAEQCKKRVRPSEDLSILSAGGQQELQSKKSFKSSNYKQSNLRTRHLVHKKQNVKQKLSKDTVSKKLAESSRKKTKASSKKSSNRGLLLPTVESSESKLGEEGLERESVDLNKVFSTPLPSKLKTSKIQNLANSEKRRNVLHSLKSLGGASNKTPVKAKELPRNLTSTVQNSEKRSSAKIIRKKPEKIHHKARKNVRSNSDDIEPQNTMESESSPVQDEVEKNPVSSNKKSNKRKRNMQRGSHGPLLEHDVKSTSGRRSLASKEDGSSSDSSEDMDYQINDLLSNKTARHKIVMPSNTPNVRRTKRIRLRPLEYWRGERVNYTVGPSGLVISGIVCPETEPRKKIKRKKPSHKPKRDQTRSEIAVNFDQTLADISKPTVVLDPITNKEVVLASDFAMGKLILKPLKEKGHQFVHMDTIAFHILKGKIVLTLHKTSYYLTAGDFFYVPAGNGYNIRNILNEESILLFTQVKKNRPKGRRNLAWLYYSFVGYRPFARDVLLVTPLCNWGQAPLNVRHSLLAHPGAEVYKINRIFPAF
ncbi:PREDICTED: centromere protein C [Tinamus guttatus]|uniref:centromere protein C n=1 Tax=Tinamus guttatus TaxID=94827 RepID=UPI00052E9960|nr:PREDICTED: centromere protein C [Tinamus guttatus]